MSQANSIAVNGSKINDKWYFKAQKIVILLS